MLLMAVMAGCSGDNVLTQGDADYRITEQVIADISSAKYNAIFEASGGNDYYWEVEGGSDYGTFNDPTLRKPEFIATNKALQDGEIRIRVTIDDEVKPWQTVEVLGSKHENKFYKGGFHSIVPTSDSQYNGYLAGGYIKNIGDSEPSPYIVKANNQGLKIHEKEYDGDGRFYDIEDIVLTGLGDRYYVIGYRRINRDYFEPYIARLNKKFEIENEYTYPDVIYGNSFLKGAIGIEENVSMGITHIVAAGSYEVESGAVVPYLAKVNVETNKMETKTIPGIDGSYSSLSAIAETGEGYLAVGESDYSGSRRAFILSLDSELTQNGIVDIDSSSRIHQVKKINDDKFVVVGEEGYMGIINAKGEVLTEMNIDNNISFRDILIDNNSVILVGQDISSKEGVVYKVDESTNDVMLLGKYGNYLHAVAKSTDGYYLLAGTSNDFYNYVVKIDPVTGELVDRVIN